MRSASFPASCEACGKVIHNARGFAGHLRWNVDAAHTQLKTRWTTTYQRTLWCRKCGCPWDIFDKAERDKKRCPTCSGLRQLVGKRAYESVATTPVVQSVFKTTRLQWTVGDHLYREVVDSIERGDRVRDTMRVLSISYSVFKAIGENALGVQGYVSWASARKSSVAKSNIRIAHESYMAMTPEEKAVYIEQKFGGTHTLELLFADQLAASGVTDFKMNQWQSVPVEGVMVPREADIKVTIDGTRKIVVLCDGEAFHGPKAVFVDPTVRTRDDVATAEAYFQFGYSVLRYSENEIRNGLAIEHFKQILGRLQAEVLRVYRTWHPNVERLVA
jgi:phage FluMu protein Com